MSTMQLLKNELFKKGNKQFVQEQLLKDELNILNFLRENDPDMVNEFMISLKKGRKGILRRLACSMLREDIMGINSDSHDLYVIGSIYALNVPVINEYWQKVISAFNTYQLKSGKVYKLYPISSRDCIVFPVSKTYAFNRVEIEGDILHISETEIKTIEHAAELLELMRSKEKAFSENDKQDWVKLMNELINGSANLALSYAYWGLKKEGIKKKAEDLGISNMIDWVLLKKKQDPTFNSSLFFEQLSIEGHNLHPGTKTKIGMKPKDVYRYSPEFEGIADIQFVGIQADYAEWGMVKENEKDPNAFLFKEYPEVAKLAKQQFEELGLNLNEYVVVPVHSWQLENAVPSIYQHELKEQIVVPIPNLAIPSGATSSFRTVVPINRDTQKHAIKVAINSQMTSTVRSISPNTTNNAAIFTKLIRSVMQVEHDLLRTFVPICECAGFNFKSKDNNNLKNRNLSAVFRENIESFVDLDEIAIVGSSLFSESAVSEKSILKELIERYAEKRNETTLCKAAFHFLSDYMSIVLPGYLSLMVKYGIGLEGHLQNSVIVFKDGRPIRVLFRDWGGARIYKERLNQHQIDVQFYPGSVTLTDKLTEMHNKVFYTVFQNQSGELILQMCKQFGLEEKKLWKEVHRICDSVFNELEKNPAYSESVRIDKAALYRSKVDHKALTKMRLEPEGKDYSYAIVPNPLHDFVGKRG
ncbi:MAG TPA: IucA/IucC family protein [Metabacillus sp.]|nr:IucA/IucC family protein [Metabacillus sp.]